MTTLLIMAAMTVAADKNELPANIEDLLRKGATVEIMKLEEDFDEDKKPNFHGYPLDGDSVEVKDEKARGKIADAMVKAVAAAEGGPKGFKATHGIRLVADGKTVDILLGLRTNWCIIYQGDKRTDLRITDDVANLINRIMVTP